MQLRIDHYVHAVPDTVATKLDQVLAALANLTRIGETTVGQLEDLMAVQQQILDGVSAIGGKVAAIGTEVADLITKLQAVPPNTFLDLGPAITQAQGILAAVTTVGDHLAAIPPEPA
jgi:hypothetical protein